MRAISIHSPEGILFVVELGKEVHPEIFSNFSSIKVQGIIHTLLLWIGLTTVFDLLAFFRSTPTPGSLLSSRLSGDPGNSVCRVGEREYFLAGRVWFRFAVDIAAASFREVRVTAVATLGVDAK